MIPSIFQSCKFELLKKIPDEMINSIRFSDHGMAFFVAENKHVIPLGCCFCYDQDYGQDKLGHPTVCGKRMLTSEQVKVDVSTMSPEITANLWFCPFCHKMESSFLPKFF